MTLYDLVKISPDDTVGRLLAEKIRAGDGILMKVDAGNVIKLRVDEYDVWKKLTENFFVDAKVKCKNEDDSAGYLTDKINCVAPLISNSVISAIVVGIDFELSDFSDIDTSVGTGNLLVCVSGEFQKDTVLLDDLSDVNDSNEGTILLYSSVAFTDFTYSMMVADQTLTNKHMNAELDWVASADASLSYESNYLRITATATGGHVGAEQSAFGGAFGASRVRVLARVKHDGGTIEVRLGGEVIWSDTGLGDWTDIDITHTLTTPGSDLSIGLTPSSVGDYADFSYINVLEIANNSLTFASEWSFARLQQTNRLVDDSNNNLMMYREFYNIGDLLLVDDDSDIKTIAHVAANINANYSLSVPLDVMPIANTDGVGSNYKVGVLGACVHEHAGDDLTSDVSVTIKFYIDTQNTSYANSDTVTFAIIGTSSMSGYSGTASQSIILDTSKDVQHVETAFGGISRDGLIDFHVFAGLDDAGENYISILGMSSSYEVRNYNAMYGDIT